MKQYHVVGLITDIAPCGQMWPPFMLYENNCRYTHGCISCAECMERNAVQINLIVPAHSGHGAIYVAGSRHWLNNTKNGVAWLSCVANEVERE